MPAVTVTRPLANVHNVETICAFPLRRGGFALDCTRRRSAGSN